MIREVKKQLQIPLMVGGGISSPELLRDAYDAGADIVVVGNSVEKDPQLILDFIKETEL